MGGRQGGLILLAGAGCLGWLLATAPAAADTVQVYSEQQKGVVQAPRVEKSEAEWQSALSREAYRVMRQKGTEAAFANAFWNNHASGIYTCAGCGTDLFSSTAKYDAGTGWPSFWQPISPLNVQTAPAGGRIEVRCSRCGAHLGYLYPDGPKPTGQRYSIDSAAMNFQSK